MSEAVPLPVTIDEPTRRRGRRRRAAAAGVVSFSDLTRLHHARLVALRAHDDGVAPRAVEERYQAALRAFEASHGEMLAGYWCTTVESAAVITRKPDTGVFGRLRPGVIRLHRVSDYVTRDRPEVADLLHACDALAVRASEVLRGTTQRICMELVMSSVSRLLALVDDEHASITTAERAKVLVAQRHEIARTLDYYRKTARREAQIVYTFGMILGAVLLAALASGAAFAAYLAGASLQDIATPWGAFVAGAVGAVVSVASRVTHGTFAVDYECGRGTLRRLGSFRPLLGCVFGIATYFALQSGLVTIAPDTSSTSFTFYTIVLAFVAGFSERWARGVLVGAAEDTHPSAPAKAPARKHEDEPEP